MTDQPANAHPGDGINLTEHEARAALYPFLNRVPAPRPVPTTAHRLADARRCGHTPEQHRHDDGQDADAASHARAMRELTADRDHWRRELNNLHEAYARATTEREQARSAVKTITADRDRLARDLDSTQQVATYRQGVIDLHGAELGAAGEVIAVVRDAQEQIERALARYDTAPEVTPVDDEPDLDDALEHAESALIDRDDSVWRPGDGGLWTTRYLEPMTRDEIDEQFGPTRAVLLINIEQDGEQDDAAPRLGSVSPRAQDADLAPWIRRAVGDPGSIVGDRRGPSWPECHEGWAEQQETINAWTTRAILAVIHHGGRPHCERCEQVIHVDDMYDPPLPGIGLWEHKGDCPPVEARS